MDNQLIDGLQRNELIRKREIKKIKKIKRSNIGGLFRTEIRIKIIKKHKCMKTKINTQM